MDEELPLSLHGESEQMLYDEKTQTYICPKCGNTAIYIFKRPVKNLYQCYNCGFASRGAIGMYYVGADAEYKFSCDE